MNKTVRLGKMQISYKVRPDSYVDLWEFKEDGCPIELSILTRNAVERMIQKYEDGDGMGCVKLINMFDDMGNTISSAYWLNKYSGGQHANLG